MKLKEILFSTLVVLGFVAILVYTHAREKSIVYVQTGDLYDGFDLKKELEQVYTKVVAGRKQQLDSLESELKFLNQTLEKGGAKKELIEMFQAKRESYLQKKQRFEEDNTLMQEQYTGKIRKQLNQYVADYGREHHYDYILGAEGSGALMYAREKDDVTKEVLTYINGKYKGIK